MFNLTRMWFSLAAFLILQGSYVAHTGVLGQHSSVTLNSESGAALPDVQCADIFSCVDNNHEKQEQMNAKGREEACRILTTTYQCVRSAVSDCRRQGQIQAAPMKTMSSYLRKMEDRLQTFCAHIYLVEILGTTAASFPTFQPSEMMTETYDIITAALPRTVSNNVRKSRVTDVMCEDIKSCSQGLGEIQAMMTARYVDAGCSLLFDAYQCLKSATVNCKARRLRSQAVMQSLEQHYRRMEDQLSNLCRIIFEPEEKCEGITPCLDGLNPIGELISSGGVDTACHMLLNARDCLKKASADCKTRGIINAQDLQAIDSSYRTVEADVDRFCAHLSTASGVTGQSIPSTLETILSPSTSASSPTLPRGGKNYIKTVTCDGVEPCFDGYKGITELVFSKGHHAACKVLPNAHECVQSAIADCEALGIPSLKALKLRYRIMLNQLERYCAIGSEDSRLDFESSVVKREDNDYPTNTLVQTKYWKQKYQFNVRCEDIAICLGGFKGIRGLVFTRGYEEACNVLSHAYGCLKAVTLDCKRRGMGNAFVRSIKIRYRTKLRRLNRFCTLSLPELPEERVSKTRPMNMLTQTPTTTTTTSTTTSPTPFTRTAEQFGSIRANVIFCGDITPCLNGYDGTHELVKARGYQEACRVLPNAYKCLESVMRDCRRRRISVRALTTARSRYLHMFQQLERYCSTAAPATKVVDVTSKEETTTSDIPTTYTPILTTTRLSTTTARKEDIARCRYILPCLGGHPGIRELVIAEGYEATCRMLPSVHKCLDEVTADCEKRRVRETEIQSTKTQHRMMVDRLERYCTPRAPVPSQQAQTGTKSDAIDLIVPTQSPSTEMSTKDESCADIMPCLGGFKSVREMVLTDGFASACRTITKVGHCSLLATKACERYGMSEAFLTSMKSQHRDMIKELDGYCAKSSIDVTTGSWTSPTTRGATEPPSSTLFSGIWEELEKPVGENAECEDITKCLHGFNRIGQLPYGGYRSVCSLLFNAYQCMKSATEDCTNRDLKRTEILQSLQSHNKAMEEELHTFCPSYAIAPRPISQSEKTTSTTETTTSSATTHKVKTTLDYGDCEVITSCLANYDQVDKLLSSGDTRVACSVMWNAYECSNSVAATCTDHGVLRDEDLLAAGVNIKAMKEKIDLHCPDVGRETTTEKDTTTQTTDIPWIWKNKDFEDVKCENASLCTKGYNRIAELFSSDGYFRACSVMLNAYYCLRSASMDCTNHPTEDVSVRSMRLKYTVMEDRITRFCPSYLHVTTLTTTPQPLEISTMFDVKCLEINSCYRNFRRIAELMAAKEYDESCRYMYDAYWCFQSALADCRQRGMMAGQALHSIQLSFDAMEKQMNVFCPKPTPAATNSKTRVTTAATQNMDVVEEETSTVMTISCEGIMLCSEVINRFDQLLGSKAYDSACRLRSNIYDCLKSALTDCETRGIMSTAALQSIEVSYRNVENQAYRFCPTHPTGASLIFQPGMLGRETMLRNFSFSSKASDRRSDSPVITVKCEGISLCLEGLKRIEEYLGWGRYGIACSLMKYASDCLKSAKMDCQERNAMDREALQTVEISAQGMEIQVSKYCPESRREELGWTDFDVITTTTSTPLSTASMMTSMPQETPTVKVVDSQNIATSPEATITATVIVSSTDQGDESTESVANVKCEDVISCLQGLRQLGLLKSAGGDALCRVVSSSHKCLKSALSDCNRHGVLTGEGLRSVERSLNSIEDLMKKHCETYFTDEPEQTSAHTSKLLETGTPTKASTTIEQETSTADKGTQCEDVTSCLSGLNKVGGLLASGEEDTACSLMSNAYKCLKSAVSDCKKRGIMSTSAIQTIEMSYKSMEDQISSVCPSSSPEPTASTNEPQDLTTTAESTLLISESTVAANVKCEDVTVCLKDLNQITNVMATEGPDAVCRLMSRAYRCLKSVVSDCKNSGIMDPAAFQTVEMSYRSMEGQIASMCPDITDFQSPTTSLETTSPMAKPAEIMKCEELTSCLRDLSQVGASSESFDNTCSVMSNAYQCMTSAIADCKSRQVISGVAMQSLEMSYKSLENQFKGLCPSTFPESTVSEASSPASAATELSSGVASTNLIFTSSERMKSTVTKNVKCEDIVSCTVDTRLISELIASGQSDAACSLMYDAYYCVKSALTDCENNGLLYGTALKSIEATYKGIEDQTNKYCAHLDAASSTKAPTTPTTMESTEATTTTTTTVSTEPTTTPTTTAATEATTTTTTTEVTEATTTTTTTEPTSPSRPHPEETMLSINVKCEDAMSCFTDTGLDLNCSLMSNAVQCLKAAVLDCRRRKAVSPIALQSIKRSYRAVQRRFVSKCTTTTASPQDITDSTFSVSDVRSVVTDFASIHMTTEKQMEEEVSTSTSVKCQDIMSCVETAMQVQQLSTSNQPDDFCSIMSDAVLCLESAISDCQERGMSHHGVRSLEITLTSVENQRNMLCPTPPSGDAQESIETTKTSAVKPETIAPTFVATESPISSTFSTSTEEDESSHSRSFKCEEMQSCAAYANDINQFFASGQLDAACSAMSQTYQCMKSSISDCRERNVMGSSMLQSLERSAKTVKDQMKRLCLTQAPTQSTESTDVDINSKTNTTKFLVTEPWTTPELPLSTEKEEGSSLMEVKCEEIQSCAEQAQGFGQLLASGQHDAACSAMSNSYQCLKSSVSDCRERNLLDDSSLRNLETTYMRMKDQISTVCPTISSESLKPTASTSTTEGSITQFDHSTKPLVQTSTENEEKSSVSNFKCEDMQVCGEKANGIGQLISSGQADAACSAMSDAYHCLKSAVSDCRGRGLMDESMLHSLGRTSLNLENQISTMCSTPSPESLEPTTSTLRTESSTMQPDFSTTPIAETSSEKEEKSSVANFKCEDMQVCGVKANGIGQLISSGQMDSVCSAMSDAYHCMKSAVSDCQDRGLIDESTLYSLDMATMNLENQISTMCSTLSPESPEPTTSTLKAESSTILPDLSTTSIGETSSVKEEKSSVADFKCEDMQVCGEKANDIAHLISSGQMDSACSAMADANHCLKSAISDCRDHGLMSESTLHSLEMASLNLENQLSTMCPTPFPESLEPTSTIVNTESSTTQSHLSTTPFAQTSSEREERSSAANYKCEDMQVCGEKANDIAQLMSSGQMDATCSAMSDAYYCMRSAVSDCQDRGLIDESTLYSLDMATMNLENQISTMCSTLSPESPEPTTSTLKTESSTILPDLSTTSIGETSSVKEEKSSVADFKCEDMQVCGEKANDIAHLISSGQMDSACSAMADANHCLKSAISDCRDHGLMSESTLHSLEMASLNLENQLSTMCPTPFPESLEPTSTIVITESSTTQSHLSTTPFAQTSSEREERSSVANYKCEDMQVCGEKANDIAQLMSSGQMDAACSAMADANHCLKSAISDCRDHGLMSESTLHSLEMASLNLENQLSTMCPTPFPDSLEPTSTIVNTESSTKQPDVSTTPFAQTSSEKEERSSVANFKCEDMQVCGEKASGIAQLISSGQTDMACSVMSEAYQCLQSAVSDCKDRGNVDDSTLRSLETSSSSLEDYISLLCPSTLSENMGPTALTIATETSSLQSKISDLLTTLGSQTSTEQRNESSFVTSLTSVKMASPAEGPDIENITATLFSTTSLSLKSIDKGDRSTATAELVDSDSKEEGKMDMSSTSISSNLPEAGEWTVLPRTTEAFDSNTTLKVNTDSPNTPLHSVSSETGELTAIPNVTCEDVMSCTADGLTINDLLESEQFEAACRLMSNAYQCMKSAITDCRHREMLRESVLGSLEMAHKNLAEEVKKTCPTSPAGNTESFDSISTVKGNTDASNTPMHSLSTETVELTTATPNVRCEGVMSCTADGLTISDLLESEQFEAACRLMSNAYQCMKSALTDCKDREMLAEGILGSLETAHKNLADEIKKTCPTSPAGTTEAFDSNTTVKGNTDSPNTPLHSVSPETGELTSATPNVRCEGVMSCTADGPTISDLLESEQFEAACRLMSTAYQCMKSAITDCKDREMLREDVLGTLEMAQENLADEIKKTCHTSPMGTSEAFDSNTTVKGNTDAPNTPMHSISSETMELTAIPTNMVEANDSYTTIEGNTDLSNTTVPSVSSETEESPALSDVKCEGIMSCTADGEDISELLSSHQFDAACSLMSKAHLCLNSAISDCKNRNMLSDDVLESLEMSLSTLVEARNKTCPSHPTDAAKEDVIGNTTIFEDFAISTSPKSSALPQEGEGTASLIDVTKSTASSISTENDSLKPQEPEEEAAFMNVKCRDIMKCATQMEQLGYLASTGQLDAFCRSMPSTRQCLHSAVSDCQKHGYMPEEIIQTLKNSFNILEQQVGTNCPSEHSGLSPSMPIPTVSTENLGGSDFGRMSSATSTVAGKENTSPFINATCRDIGMCTNNMVPLDDLASSGQYDKLCGSVSDVRQCLNSAVSDCRKSGLVPEETLQSMENDFKSMEERFETFCPSQQLESSPGMQVSTVSNEVVGGSEVKSISTTISITVEKEISSALMNAKCGDLMTCVEQMGPLEDLASSQQFEKLCRSMSNVRQCLHSAVSDCRERSLMSEEELQSIKNDFDFVEEHFETFCSSHSGSPSSMPVPTISNENLTTNDVNLMSAGTTLSTPAEKKDSSTSTFLHVKCEDAMQCLVDSARVGELVTSGKRDVACNLMANAGLCVKSVLADCRSREIMINSALESIEMSYNTMESQMRRFCQGAAAGLDDITDPTGYLPRRSDTTVDVQPTAMSGKTTRKAGGRYSIDITCDALPSCSTDSALMDVLGQSGQTDVMCSVMRNAKSCMQSALLDCKRRQELSDEEIQSTEQSIKELEDEMISICPLSSPDLMQGQPGQ